MDDNEFVGRGTPLELTINKGSNPRPPEDDARKRPRGPAARSEATGNDIGWAVRQMWSNQAVRRRGWNGKGMYLKIQVPDDESKMSMPFVWIRTVNGLRVPWLCSQTDLLAKDWEIA